MIWLLIAQVAPVASSAVAQAADVPGPDWLRIAGNVALALLPAFLWLARRNAQIVRAFKILQGTALKHEHGESWTQAAIETAREHPQEVRDLVESAIPDGLLSKVKPLGGSNGSAAP